MRRTADTTWLLGLLMVVTGVPAAGAGCSRRPEAGASPAPRPAPDAAAETATGATDAAVLVPPAPSGWAPGRQFRAPPPTEVASVPASPGFNMLRNPRFEQGTEPWWYFPDRPTWGGFTAQAGPGRGQDRAARLELRVDADHAPPYRTHIRGIIQDLHTPVVPSRVGGTYYVERWQRGAVDQYLQFVVICAAAEMSFGPVANRQIRYLLAGIEHPPFDISNAHFVYLTRVEPVVGQWVSFERDLRQDFLEQWGSVPERVQSVRVLFEVRYDNMDLARPSPLHAVVYFDDLYLGT